MKLSELKEILKTKENIQFELPNGTKVKPHFHVTEIGELTRKSIDCGGTVRTESVANIQLWETADFYHRLKGDKLISIIEGTQKTLDMGDLDIEVEYQGSTIGKYGLDYKGENFLLTSQNTECKAHAACGSPKELVSAVVDKVKEVCCSPESNCC